MNNRDRLERGYEASLVQPEPDYDDSYKQFFVEWVDLGGQIYTECTLVDDDANPTIEFEVTRDSVNGLSGKLSHDEIAELARLCAEVRTANGEQKMTEPKQLIKEKMTELMELIYEHCHPHTTAIVTGADAELVEGVMSVVNEKLKEGANE